MTIKVIGAGFGRTGTLSLKAALEELGFGKCYHMLELLQHLQQVTFWENASQGKSIDWDTLFEDYQATVDFPGYCYYRQLIQQYPDAKVLLSVREPNSWYESTEAISLTGFERYKWASDKPESIDRGKVQQVKSSGFMLNIIDSRVGKFLSTAMTAFNLRKAY